MARYALKGEVNMANIGHHGILWCKSSHNLGAVKFEHGEFKGHIGKIINKRDDAILVQIPSEVKNRYYTRSYTMEEMPNVGTMVWDNQDV